MDMNWYDPEYVELGFRGGHADTFGAIVHMNWKNHKAHKELFTDIAKRYIGRYPHCEDLPPTRETLARLDKEHAGMVRYLKAVIGCEE